MRNKIFLVLILICILGCSKVASVKVRSFGSTLARPIKRGGASTASEAAPVCVSEATPVCAEVVLNSVEDCPTDMHPLGRRKARKKPVSPGMPGALAAVKKEDLVQDFTLGTIDGANISLSDYKGKKSVLVVFWATWCPYCVEEIPILNKMKEKYYDKIEILGINIKESPEKVGNFVKERNIKYTILLDSAGEVARKYGVSGIPMNILIDRDWKIIYKGHSIEECEESWQRQLQR